MHDLHVKQLNYTKKSALDMQCKPAKIIKIADLLKQCKMKDAADYEVAQS